MSLPGSVSVTISSVNVSFLYKILTVLSSCSSIITQDEYVGVLSLNIFIVLSKAATVESCYNKQKIYMFYVLEITHIPSFRYALYSMF